jgi:NADH-quinone oxidoreductase subunit J
MPDKAEMILFWVFAMPLMVAAAGVLISRNPVYAAMNLVAAFFFLAGIYILLTAHLVAFLQILVYAGAIMVLFLFVVMLLSLTDDELGMPKVTVMKALGCVGAAGLGFVIVRAIQDMGVQNMAAVEPRFGTVKAVGRLLFTQYLLPFEATSLLLLVAIVGAVVIAKQKI